MRVAMLFTNNLNYFLSLQLYFVGSLLTGCVNRLILESRVPLKFISTYSITSLLVVIFRLQIPFHHFISFLTLAPISFCHLHEITFRVLPDFLLQGFLHSFKQRGSEKSPILQLFQVFMNFLDLFK